MPKIISLAVNPLAIDISPACGQVDPNDRSVRVAIEFTVYPLDERVALVCTARRTIVAPTLLADRLLVFAQLKIDQHEDYARFDCN